MTSKPPKGFPMFKLLFAKTVHNEETEGAVLLRQMQRNQSEQVKKELDKLTVWREKSLAEGVLVS